MHRFWIIAAVALAFSAGGAAAQDKRPAPKSLDEAAEATRQALEGVMNTFRGLVESFPAYEAPQVLDNGDIIIRKKKNEAKPVPPKSLPKKPDELKT